MRISDWSSDVCSSDLARKPIGQEIGEITDQAADQDRAGNKCEGHPPAADQCRSWRSAFKHCAAYFLIVPVLHPCGTCALRRSEEHTSELQSLMRISYAVL